jgi:hypothetical protein
MGWRGALRSIEAAGRSAERNARRRHNELARQQKNLNKMLELQRASFEVELYNNHIELLKSIHKECGPFWDWRAIKATEPPVKPTRSQRYEREAQLALQNFTPSFFDKLLRRVESKRSSLANAITEAEERDKREHLSALELYQSQHSDWEDSRSLAERVLSGDKAAYGEVIKEIGPFREINELGSRVRFTLESSSLIDITLSVKGEDVIPKETKALLQSGKLSTKKMPKGQFYELYQDYVCGCVLRIAREVFALLPFEVAVVTAVGDVVNTQTGHLEEQPVLSVVIPRQTIQKLNLDTIDPSDSMKNFVHRMDFRKTTGLQVVRRIDPLTLTSSD